MMGDRYSRIRRHVVEAAIIVATEDAGRHMGAEEMKAYLYTADLLFDAAEIQEATQSLIDDGFLSGRSD